MIINETEKMLMVMRPYQVYAVESIVSRALDTNNNGYVCVSKNGITGIVPNDDKINWAKIIPESINVGYWHIGQAYYDTLNYIISKI